MPGGPSPSVGPSDSHLPGARYHPGLVAPARLANATQGQAPRGCQRELLRGSQGVPQKPVGTDSPAGRADPLTAARGPHPCLEGLGAGTTDRGGSLGTCWPPLAPPPPPRAGLFYLVHVSTKLNGAAPVPEVFPETTGGGSWTRGWAGRCHLPFILLLNPEERKRLLGRCRAAPGPSVCSAGRWSQASGRRTGSLSALRPTATPQELPPSLCVAVCVAAGNTGGGGGSWTG